MAEPAIRHSDEWIRVAEGRLGLGFWSWDVQTGKLSCSAGLYALVGVNAASVHLDLAFLESLVHPSDRLVVDGASEFVAESYQEIRQFRLIRPDGQLRHLHSVANRIFDRDGRPSRIVAAVSDVTEGYDKARRLDRNRALLHAVARIASGVVWVGDEHGRLLECFAEAETAGDPSNVDMGDWRQRMEPEDADHLAQLWREANARGKPYSFSPWLRYDDGQLRQLHIVGLPLAIEQYGGQQFGGLASYTRHSLLSLTDEKVVEDLRLTPNQVRACRALLDWSADTLAQNAGISVSTVRRIESADPTAGQGDSLRLVVLAFREAGLVMSRGTDGRFCVVDAS